MSYSDYDNSATGYVYVIRFGNRVKVGFSINPEKRFDHLPYEEVVAVVPGCRWVEGAFHDLLRPWRVCGEWFRCSPQMLVLIREELTWYQEHPCECRRCQPEATAADRFRPRTDAELEIIERRQQTVAQRWSQGSRWPQPQDKDEIWGGPVQGVLFTLLESKVRARRRRGTPHPRSVTT